ncbi:MAG: DUF1080 domain-containing protein [Luteolibacter sp.]
MSAKVSPKDTERWEPVPPVVSTSPEASVPSDAIVLFDGKDLSQWEGGTGGESTWKVEDGVLTVRAGAGDLVTKRAFADCQLHLEWRCPAKIEGKGQGRGNSGIFFQKLYEVQILDSVDNVTYANGQAGSVYKQYAPLVNASKAAGEWQTYDIVFRAPRFNADGSLRSPAFLTVFQNGVLVQNHVEVKGPTAFQGTPPYEFHPFKQALRLQDHGNGVSFRNIWIRELRTEQTEVLFNGKDLNGWYTYQDEKRNEDTKKNFNVENGVLHILGDGNGYVATEKSYEDYHLTVDFRWGTKKWEPRLDHPRDSGILFHFSEDVPDKVWPVSIECQVQEGDCGDIWFIETRGKTEKKGKKMGSYTRVIKDGDFENPSGEWNTMEVVTVGDRFEFYVNGRLVNSATETSARRGKILLQSECAEVFYRNVTLTPLQ